MGFKDIHKLRLVRSNALTLSLFFLSCIGILTYIGTLRYENFYTTNWDFGIAEQLLWTGAHGRLLFETADFSTSYTLSFLQVHSTYIALLIAQVYSLFPTAFFLVLIQATILSLSIFPLFLISSSMNLDRRMSYAIIMIYMFSFTVMSAFFYDFHWELFIPLEYLSLFYLIQKRRYVIASIPFIAGVCTIEVFPMLTLGLFLYFAYSYYGWGFLKVKSMRKNRDWRVFLFYFIASLVAYFLIRYLQFYVIPGLVGIHGGITTSISSTGLIPTRLSFNSLTTSVIYWIIFFASFGFIPLLSKKCLFLLAPWLIGSIIINPVLSAGFGNQYPAVGVPLVIIGFAQGLSIIAKSDHAAIYSILMAFFTVIISLLTFALNGSLIFLNPAPPLGIRGSVTTIPLFLLTLALVKNPGLFNKFKKLSRYAKKISIPKTLIIMIISFLVFNLIIGPLNTNNFHDSVYPGYWISYTPNPEFQYASKLASEIPNSASVLASDNLFPMVANNPNAYSLLWYPYNSRDMPNLPFNSSVLPDYIFIDSYQNFLPLDINSILANTSAYGLLGHIFYKGYPGQIYLYELNYRGDLQFYNASQH